MDTVNNLERIFKLVLKGGSLEGNEAEWLKSLRLKQMKISETIITDDYTRTHLEEVLTSTELMLKLFVNNYEPSFNVFIESILHEILNGFRCALFREALSDFPFDNLFSLIRLIIKITIDHPCDTIVETLINFYKWNLDEIKLKRIEYDSAPIQIEELTVHLRIVSIIYEVIYSSEEEEMKDDHHGVQELLNCIMSGNQECELFVKLVCENSEVLMIQTLVDVIPKFIKIMRSHTVLQLIWEEICNLYRINSGVENLKMFIIFGYLSDFYFKVDNKQMMTDIFTNSTYWILIQKGLINSDSAIRKQALFLTKASLNYIVENDVTFYCYEKGIETFQGGEILARKLPLIYWEHAMKFDKLKELCIIVEYLEEKQVHIVKPIFSTIECYLDNIQEQKLHISWILIVIQRMLSHDNIQIVRQGISNLTKISVIYYHESGAMTEAIKLLVRSLNCTQVYMTDLLLLLEELKTYFENCTKHENGKYFFRILLEEMCDVQWSSEALYAVIYSLRCVKSKNYWCIKEMNLIKKLLTTRTANQYTYIKCGMQCQLLVAAINLIDTHGASLEDIDNFLNCYHRKILQRKTVLWESVAKWIRKFSCIEDVQRFISIASGKRNIGRMMVLLCDAYADDENLLQEMKHFLKNISGLFVGAYARPYCNKAAQDCYLSTICDVMIVSCGDLDFWNIFCPFLSDIVLYIKLQLESIYHIGDFETCKIFVKYLATVLTYDGHRLILSHSTSKWFNDIVENLVSKGDSNFEFPIQEFIQITIVNMLMDYNPRETHGIESYLRRKVNSSLVKTSEDLILTKDLQTLWGRMNSEFLRGKWEVLSKIDASPSKVLQVSKSEFIACCFEAIDLSGHTVLFPLISTLGKALPSILDESGLEELIDCIWKVVTDRKKNEEYLSLVKQFVEAVFQLEVIQNGNGGIRRMLVNYSKRMLSQNTTAPANILIKHMQKLGFHEGVAYLLQEVLPRSLIFGQMLKKDERLIRELYSNIETTGLSPLANDFSSSNEVRARSVQIILALNPVHEVHRQFSDNLFESLMELEESTCRDKMRYFSDSHVHRVKQRLFQALLVLEPYITKEGSEKLWNWLSKKILFENNQPSVRYLQEWLMMRIISRNPRCRISVWTYFDEGLEKRTGSLCSLISVIYHSLKCLSGDEMAEFVERAVKTFLPYCMAQHFSVRLYAQVALQKLLELAANRSLNTITEKYNVVKQSLEESITGGNAMKNSAKMREDFYFTVFDPAEHYSLQTIFFELPRLTSVKPEEFISESLFRKTGVDPDKAVVPLTNGNDALMKVTFGKWISEGTKQDNFTADSDENSGVWNFQKKSIPVKYLIPDRDELLQSASFSSKKEIKDGLVVVASLIDRLPNLGGLSRTCEVFGACELVIGSLKYIDDKQFQSLSVTAEKWISITEVKPFYLADYLIRMKRNGYKVLAAEQTVNSQPLQSVKFPKKSLLLLGNEKEGIPPTLLPLTDVRIEIPQLGVIRSLNVHVTGALFVWEYAKQHLFS